MYVLDPIRFEESLKNKGYKSLSEFAANQGIHRNTIHYYLRGQPVFSKKLQQIFLALDVDPVKLIIEKSIATPADKTAPIADAIDQLQTSLPQAAYVLFGSRARAGARRYSDWDIGVFKESGLARDEFRILKRRLDELQEASPYFIDLINLNGADELFLKNISRDWCFLAGRHRDWVALQRKAVI